VRVVTLSCSGAGLSLCTASCWSFSAGFGDCLCAEAFALVKEPVPLVEEPVPLLADEDDKLRLRGGDVFLFSDGVFWRDFGDEVRLWDPSRVLLMCVCVLGVCGGDMLLGDELYGDCCRCADCDAWSGERTWECSESFFCLVLLVDVVGLVRSLRWFGCMYACMRVCVYVNMVVGVVGL
jgi:hypothetical protein